MNEAVTTQVPYVGSMWVANASYESRRALVTVTGLRWQNGAWEVQLSHGSWESCNVFVRGGVPVGQDPEDAVHEVRPSDWAVLTTPDIRIAVTCNV